jgi:hypothetical protein
MLFSANAQTYDINFKVRELTKGTGVTIENVKVDVDSGAFIGFTDSNGVAHIHDVNDGIQNSEVNKEKVMLQ